MTGILDKSGVLFYFYKRSLFDVAGVSSLGRCLEAPVPHARPGREMGHRNKRMVLDLLPRKLKQCDLICILLGCSTLWWYGEDGEAFLYLIREAYIHGMMDGEICARKRLDYHCDDETVVPR